MVDAEHQRMPAIPNLGDVQSGDHLSMASVVALASEGGDPMRLGAVVRRAPQLMTALRAAREVDPPDWLVTAGAVRDAVWDALQGRPPTAAPRDVDLAFFDPVDLSSGREQAVEARLKALTPDVWWEARNKAGAHLWYRKAFGIDVPPFASSAEAIATFPETASCVGIRLLSDDDLLVVAPHGLDDLLDGICRHNGTLLPAELYEYRVTEKGWRMRWPGLTYIDAARDHNA